MIDLVTVRKLQMERIERQLEKERKIQISNFNYLDNKQQAFFAEAEQETERTQHDFPKILASVERNIIQSIDSGSSSYSYIFLDSVYETYIVKMLLDVLPLHGYICSFQEGKLYIRW